MRGRCLSAVGAVLAIALFTLAAAPCTAVLRTISENTASATLVIDAGHGGFDGGADEQRQNGQNANGQNRYRWTYHRTRRRGGLLWRILTIYLVIQFILTLFGGCGYRLNSGYDYSADPYDPYSNYYSDYYGGSSGQPSGTTTPQQNTRGFGSINS